jgi:glycosyltransferase involved in cell wall biosynthesis
LSDAYGGSFVAWFAERANEEFPYQDTNEPRFAHRYLSEVGYWQLFKELKADREAVVILGGWSSPMTNQTLLMTTALRIPVFIWADHPHPKKRRWLVSRSRQLYLAVLSRLASGFLACGQPTAEHLVWLGIAREKITNFPYWVELPRDWSVPKRCLDEEAAKQPLRLLAVGRHVPVKQFEVAIRAVALANSKAGRILARLAIAGDGPEHESLKNLAQSLGCEATVSFPGWLEIRNVYEALGEADALVLTSKFDAFGVVVLEAMAAGRPVLASNGVIAALDRDEGSGAVLLHPAGDAEFLAKQIAKLANDREQLRSASVAARSIAEQWPPERATRIVDEILARTNPNLRLLRNAKPSTVRSSVNAEHGESAAVATSGK